MSDVPTHPERSRALRDLHARILADVQDPPHAGSVPLTIAGRRCGWASPAACRALGACEGAAVDAAGAVLGAGGAPGPVLDALLARVAATLREAGCLRGWRDELLDVTADDGTLLGAIERAAVRPLGLPTRAVHLNAWSPAGELWIARRALDKTTDPGMWDTLVGGLAGSGESLEGALLRECLEEAGLAPGDLAGRGPLRTISRMHRRIPDGYQVEDVLVSSCVLDPRVRPANQDGEVMEIRLAPPAEVLDMIAAGAFTREAELVIVDDMIARGP